MIIVVLVLICRGRRRQQGCFILTLAIVVRRSVAIFLLERLVIVLPIVPVE
jgi:hypothetical protein